MDIDVFAGSELERVFRVLRTALNPDGPLRPPQRKFLETYARITGYAMPAADPLPIRPEVVEVEGPHRRKRLVQLAAIAALFNFPLRPDSVRFVKELAASLGAYDPVLPVLEAVASGRKLKARILSVRRWARVFLKEAYQAEGILGIARFFAAAFLKARVNKDKLWKYKKLGLLPEGTLGREFWKHMTTQGFGFPGEPWGLPEAFVYHDVSHVLNGYGTTPAGEIQQGSFQGGNRREDGFFFIQFVLLQFQHGIRLTPIANQEVGYFDPVTVLWAIHRGASCKVDITHGWDHGPLMTLGIDEARREIGLLPKLDAISSAA
jgi:hypothetical protein